MKTRNTLSAAEVDALLADLERRLQGLGMETQPEVAAKVIDLVANPGAGLRDFASAIKADPALTGRLLRLANSAFFAQRQPVSNLDRACVLLGLGRLKAVSMGFYLSRAAAADAGHQVSRRIWGESVFRACLASELAHRICPPLAPEAFVIGLMLDAGVPLLAKLEGPKALRIIQSDMSPTKKFRAEFEQLPFTHVDIATALARRWRLPEPLAKPIERHHTPAPDTAKPGSITTLHRIAFYVGALQLDTAGRPAEPAPMPLTAERTLGLKPGELEQIIRRASDEYSAMCELFREVAQNIGDVAQMVDLVQQQLVEMIDQTMMQQLQDESKPSISSFAIAQQSIEIEVGRDEFAVAYLNDAHGRRLLSYMFRRGRQSAFEVLEALGVESATAEERADLDTYLRSIAA